MKKRCNIGRLFFHVLIIAVIFGNSSVCGQSGYLDDLKREFTQNYDPDVIRELSDVFFLEQLPDSLSRYGEILRAQGKPEQKMYGEIFRARASVLRGKHERAEMYHRAAVKRVAESGTARLEVKARLEFARYYLHRHETQQMNAQLDRALKMSDSLDYIEGRAEALILSARHKLSRGLAHRALVIAEDVRKYAEVSVGFNKELLHELLAECFAASKKYDRALKEYKILARKYSEKNKMYKHAEMLLHLASIYGENKKFKQSESHLLKAKEIYENAEMPLRAGKMLMELGELWYGHNPVKSNYYFNEAVSFFKAIGHRRHVAEAFLSLGRSREESGESEKAATEYEDALRIFRELDDSGGESEVLKALGRLYTKAGDISKASKYLLENKRIADASSDLRKKAEALQLLSKARSRSGDYEGAYLLEKQLRIIEDSLKQLQSEARLRDIQDRLTSVENRSNINEANARREIDKLSKENEMLRGAHRANRIIYYTTLAVITLLILYGAYKRIKLKRKMKLQDVKIEELNIELYDFIDIHDVKNRRISGHLSEGVARTLDGVKNSFRRFFKEMEFQNTMQQARYKQSLEYLDESCREVDTISNEVFPSELRDKGLAEALSGLLSSAFEGSSISVDFDYFGVSSEERFGMKIEVNTYFTVKELLINISKHSGARRVWVKVFKSRGQLQVTVEDDGKGFKPEGDIDIKRGKGLAMIRSRTRVINADLHYEPRGGTGTIVRLNIPLL